MPRMPYHFVPVKPELTIKSEPVDHLRIDRSRKSGEMLVSFKTLTPTICGHYQFKFSDLPQNVQNELNDPRHGNFVPKKHVLEPLVLPATGNSIGRIAIPGTSLKGMIRQAVSSLLSAPMEKVQEKKFSFRPNLAPENTNHIIPAIITDISKDGTVTVGWGKMTDFIFCKKECRDVFAREQLSTRIVDRRINGLVINRVGFRNKLGVGESVHFESALIGKYHYGIDGSGYFAGAFRGLPPNSDNIAYKWGIINDFDEKNTLILPKKLLEQFFLTRQYYFDRVEGHLLNHPNPPQGEAFMQAMQNLCGHGMKKGVVVFLELPAGHKEPSENGSNILSMGFHFRYRWMYRDSILRKQEKIRSEIFNSETEEFNGPGLPVETNGSRSFFGFVDEKGKRSLAGRISVNMALEQNFERPENQRFVTKNGKTFLVLKPLGSPKPSAVEMYLTQDNIGKREDKGILCTYGEFSNDQAAGDLNGRKGYLHQPPVNANNDHFLLQPGEENYDSEQSTIVNLVSKPNTEFRFKLRFSNLADWEIGALLFATAPEVEDVKKIFEGMNLGSGVTLPSELKKLIALAEAGDKSLPLFAQKIGHGRPLGLGSIKINIDAVKIWDFSKKLPELTNDSAAREHYLKALGNFVAGALEKDKARLWLKQIVLQWLKIRRFRGQLVCIYPTKKDKHGKETIYNYHSEVRRIHSQKRKEKKTADVQAKSNLILSDLDLD